MQALETYGAGDLVEALGDYLNQTEQRQAESASEVAILKSKVTKLEATSMSLFFKLSSHAPERWRGEQYSLKNPIKYKRFYLSGWVQT